jgi:ribosomal protein L20
MAGEQVVQSLNFAYIGRRLKKRNFRRIWIYKLMLRVVPEKYLF